MEDLSTAIRLSPGSPTVYLVRAITWLDREGLKRALADCDEAVRLDPKDPVTHLIRSIVLANKGEFGSAFRELVRHPMLRNSPGRERLIMLLH
jgi:hypothetical protein